MSPPPNADSNVPVSPSLIHNHIQGSDGVQLGAFPDNEEVDGVIGGEAGDAEGAGEATQAPRAHATPFVHAPPAPPCAGQPANDHATERWQQLRW